MSILAVPAAVAIDTLLGEPRRWHPLVGFGRYAGFIEKRLNVPDAYPGLQRGYGVLAVMLAIAPTAVFFLILDGLPHASFLAGVVALYFAIGHRSLREHALDIYAALREGDLARARTKLARIVSRDTAELDAKSIATAAVESVLENGNDAVFGAIFWFVIAGAPGTVVYRLVNTLDAMWGYHTDRYRDFGWAAARLDDVLNFIPARLTALGYSLLGDTARALRCWRTQASAWDSPNAGPVMTTGAGALKLSLGGSASYDGIWTERPALGEGVAADADSILRALNLVLRTLLLWLLLALACAAVTRA